VQGQPVAPELLARLLHRVLDEVLARSRAHPELEYDAHGNLVGSGLTLVPTAHQFRVKQHILFAWCAFDTLTYPVELHVSVHITSRCPVTGRSILLSVTPEQVRDLDPPGAAVSLVAHENVYLSKRLLSACRSSCAVSRRISAVPFWGRLRLANRLHPPPFRPHSR
jgi:alkylmercury lyase